MPRPVVHLPVAVMLFYLGDPRPTGGFFTTNCVYACRSSKTAPTSTR